jgi:hypothetical protein
VEDQFTAVGRTLLDSLRSEATVFINPLVEAGDAIVNSFNEVGDLIGKIFGQAALQVKPLTTAITGFVKELLPGIATAVQKARPLIEALAAALPQLGRDLSTAFAILADGSPQAVVALRDLLSIIGMLIIVTATFVRGLSDLYFWMRVTSLLMRNDLAGAAVLLADREYAAKLASGQLTDELKPARPSTTRPPSTTSPSRSRKATGTSGKPKRTAAPTSASSSKPSPAPPLSVTPNSPKPSKLAAPLPASKPTTSGRSPPLRGLSARTAHRAPR